MKQILISKLWHGKARFALFFAILLMAMLFFGVAVQLYIQSVQSARIIEENTTTLAIEQLVVMGDEETGYTITTYDTGVAEQVRASQAVKSVHQSTTLSGRIEGIEPVLPPPSMRADYHNNTDEMLSTERVAAFHVRCNAITLNGFFYWVDATVIETLEINSQLYRPYEDLVIYGNLVNAEGDIPFVEGKEYVVAGQYSAPLAYSRTTPMGKKNYYQPPEDDAFASYTLDLSLPGSTDLSDTDAHTYIQDGEGNRFLCFYLSQDVPQVVEIDDPRVKKTLEWVRLNQELLYVTGISTVQGVPLFAMDEAYIDSGRDFTKEEAEEGQRVCLVSTKFASAHGLQLGDTIPLSLYPNQVEMEWMGRFYLMDLLAVGTEPAATETYTIVGIYRTLEWQKSRFCFSPNTIFVPENSIEVAGGVMGVDYSDSLILHNGSNAQFLADAQAAGADEGAFVIYDGGYVEYMESLQLMRRDTRMVLIVCTLLYLTVVLSSAGMMAAHLKQDAAIMRRIGASSAYTRRYMLLCMLPPILLSAVVSYGVSCLIHGPMMQVLETWYTLSRPVFSNLTAGSAGMLTGTMGQAPSLFGAIIGVVIACMITWVLVRFDKERRTL